MIRWRPRRRYSLFFGRGREGCRQKIDALVFGISVLNFDVAQAMTLDAIDEAYERAVAWNHEVQDARR